MGDTRESARVTAELPIAGDVGIDIGRSREGRPLVAFRFGRTRAALRVSLIAGCHADEPVGPRFLAHLAAYLSTLPETHELRDGIEWWLIPHMNPDGAARNRAWQEEAAPAYDLPRYRAHAVREPPGDDIEFGFPCEPGDDGRGARPENRAALAWWRTAGGPFHLHASLHGMAFAAGPWFLIDRAWGERAEPLMAALETDVAALGYALHDVERHGEKGFHRLRRGFTTRPDAPSMRRFFEERGDPGTARLFRPSSMEAIRSLGGDALTLVSEMPLFITTGAGVEPVAMPVADQMHFIWRFIRAGLALVRGSSPG